MTTTVENGIGHELAVIEHEPAPLARVQVAPQVTAAELVSRLNVIEEAMRTAMKQDVDYGVIPGTGSKPTLLKPGAEKLGALFQLDVQLENQKIWHDDGHLTVICRATVYHQPTGTRLGSGEGICTTREAKYAFRNKARTCPACGAEAIIKGKAEYGGGWVCWKNHKTQPGCGEKFADGDPTIEQQAEGKVANENIPDAFNTVDKMASKRARIDAVLAVTGASALFTQDIEDFAADAAGGTTTAGASRAAAADTRDGGSPSDTRPASDAQKKLLGRLCDEHNVPRPDMDQLTMRDASTMIEEIKAGKTAEPEEIRCETCGALGGTHLPDCDESIPF